MAQVSVIFDLDGTLIESEEVWEDVRRHFVVTHGGRWRDDAQTTMIGMRTAEWAQYIHNDLAVLMPVDVIARDVIDGVIDRMNAHVPVLPGANGALSRLSCDFRMGLATSASLPVAETVLARTGWNVFFQVVVSADSVERGKPAPDVYLRALELLGAQAELTTAVEDSGSGIRSAKSARCSVVAIPNHAFPPEPAALAQASRVLTSLDELDSALIRSII